MIESQGTINRGISLVAGLRTQVADSSRKNGRVLGEISQINSERQMDRERFGAQVAEFQVDKRQLKADLALLRSRQGPDSDARLLVSMRPMVENLVCIP